MKHPSILRIICGGTLMAAVSLLSSAAVAGEVTKAVAVLHPTAGNNVTGTVTFTKSGDEVKVVADISGLKPGKHGFHIHEFGDCTAPDAMSAGGHFNPEGKKHGKDNPAGPHAGDMPNLDVPNSGRVKVQVAVKGLSLDGGPNALLDRDGAALVVHEGPDDYKTDPAGNAGKRLACGVIHR
jgi:Cu-Zn family superoxide dismutase